jgi:hypothetical protein
MDQSTEQSSEQSTEQTIQVTRKGKRWLPEEDKQLFEELLENIPLEKIADMHQRTVSAITLRLLMHANKDFQDGMTLEDASSHYKLPVDMIAQGLPKQEKKTNVTRKGVKWSQDEDAELLEHLNQKDSLETMAINLQRKIPAIKRRLLTLAVDAYIGGMLLEDAGNLYRVSCDKIIKQCANDSRVRKFPNQPTITPSNSLIASENNTNLEVLVEIRNLLQILVTHITKESINSS